MFATSELSLASFLAFSLECDPEVKWDNKKRKAIFYFDNATGVVDPVLDLYRDGLARVEPKEYFFKCSEIRRLMNEARPTNRVH